VKSPIFDRRRSDRLAELLDEAAGRRRHHRRTDVDAELGELVRVAGRVATLPTPEPDSDFRTGLRAMLMAKIERDGIGATAELKSAQVATRAAMAAKTQVVRQVPTGHGRTRAAVLIGVTAGALALSGVSAASTNSLPGEPLYQVQRSSERAQLALAGSDLTRAQLHLEFARSRLTEAEQLSAEQAPRVLAEMDDETKRGVNLIVGWTRQHRDPAAVDALDDFVTKQHQRLLGLPPDHAHITGVSISYLDEVTEKIKTLRQSLHR
jgi:Domain of unknown function (DUF5667)